MCPCERSAIAQFEIQLFSTYVDLCASIFKPIIPKSRNELEASYILL